MTADAAHIVYDQIRHLLLTRHSENLDNVVRMSYRHPNGFDKISLDYTSLARMTRRIHLWWPAGRDPLERRIPGHDSDIHNHPWNFQSDVLTGSILHETFSVSAVPGDGQSMEAHVIHLPADPAVKPFSTAAGRRYVRLDGQDMLGRGATYHLDTDILHRLGSVGDRPTATFVRQEPLSRRTSLVLRLPQAQPQVRVKARKFTADQVKTLLDALRDELSRR